ncbi:MAG: HD domain-containing protein [Bacillota bacterium]|jgi:uncharacterized protein|nr:HD domain-containing protein [Clostridia bacterium]
MERVQAILSHPDFGVYLKLNEQHEKNREFCCHQWQHALDVARIYYILYLEKSRDRILSGFEDMTMDHAKELIYATALLHDIGRWKQYLDPALDHAEEGAVLAKPILEDVGFKAHEIELVLGAIRAHRNPCAKGIGGLLFRADKLSRNCKNCGARSKCNRLANMETKEKLLY